MVLGVFRCLIMCFLLLSAMSVKNVGGCAGSWWGLFSFLISLLCCMRVFLSSLISRIFCVRSLLFSCSVCICIVCCFVMAFCDCRSSWSIAYFSLSSRCSVLSVVMLKLKSPSLSPVVSLWLIFGGVFVLVIVIIYWYVIELF